MESDHKSDHEEEKNIKHEDVAEEKNKHLVILCIPTDDWFGSVSIGYLMDPLIKTVFDVVMEDPSRGKAELKVPNRYGSSAMVRIKKEHISSMISSADEPVGFDNRIALLKTFGITIYDKGLYVTLGK